MRYGPEVHAGGCRCLVWKSFRGQKMMKQMGIDPSMLKMMGMDPSMMM